MTKKSANKEMAILISILMIICLMFIVVLALPIPSSPLGNYFYTVRFSFIWTWTAIITSLIIAIKTKTRVDMMDLGTGFFLGLLGANGDIVVLICIAIVYIISKEVLKNSEFSIKYLDDWHKDYFQKDMVLTVFVGVILGVFNVLLSMKYKEINLDFNLLSFYKALQPGITEEIIYRIFILHISIYFTRGNITGRINKILLLLLLIVPHTAVHYLDKIFVLQVGELITGGLILSVLYGLPISVLLLKKGLFAAISVHVAIDFISFCVFY